MAVARSDRKVLLERTECQYKRSESDTVIRTTKRREERRSKNLDITAR
jgi:hypothetical protein